MYYIQPFKYATVAWLIQSYLETSPYLSSKLPKKIVRNFFVALKVKMIYHIKGFDHLLFLDKVMVTSEVIHFLRL